MDLGAFSVSLAVKDLAVSREFYSALGFEIVGGQAEEGWLILRNGTTNIGLFQGMFEGNILTFNPGWSAEGQNVDPFTDVRQIETALLDRGIELDEKVAADGDGPAHITLRDPDGNAILIDQHR